MGKHRERTRVARGAEFCLIVGLAPSRGSDPLRPLIGRGMATILRRMTGLTEEEFESAFDRVFLFPSPPIGGAQAPWRDAEFHARSLARDVSRFPRVVLLGPSVANAFGAHGLEPYTWSSTDFAKQVAFAPDPSWGLKDPEFVRRSARWWSELGDRARRAALVREAGIRGS